jgi:hypothetical protein
VRKVALDAVLFLILYRDGVFCVQFRKEGVAVNKQKAEIQNVILTNDK